jgi:hypothetical protein
VSPSLLALEVVPHSRALLAREAHFVETGERGGPAAVRPVRDQ